MALLSDFKAFAFKGNVVDLAVGVVIGGAFGKIITAVVADLVMPLVSLVLPGGDWRAAGILLREMPDPKNNVILKYGDFVGAVIDFLVIASVLFLVVSRIVKAAESRVAPKAEAPAPTTKECKFCLESIPLKATRCRACTSEVG